jgi:hypothetical protein
VVVVEPEADLLHVVGALDTAGSLAGGLDRWQQECDQDRDDGDYDEKFNQGKSTSKHR